jgi:hypothetical protein
MSIQQSASPAPEDARWEKYMHRVRAYIIAGLLLWLCTIIYMVKVSSSARAFDIGRGMTFGIEEIAMAVCVLAFFISLLLKLTRSAAPGKRPRIITEIMFWALFGMLGFGSGLIERSLATGGPSISRAVACVLAIVTAFALLRMVWAISMSWASIGAALVLWGAVTLADANLSSSGLLPATRLQIEIDAACTFVTGFWAAIDRGLLRLKLTGLREQSSILPDYPAVFGAVGLLAAALNLLSLIPA